jgi:spore maturation protein CgeB
MQFVGRRNEAYENMKKQQGFPIRTLREQFPQRCHPPKFGLEMYDAIRHSRVSFNIESTKAGESVGNMRLFETTGVGGCLLTSTADNMAELFEDGKEVVTYSSLDECIEKARYLLDHEDVCLSIAEAGQRRTLRDHTIRKRCQQIDAVIQSIL